MESIQTLRNFRIVVNGTELAGTYHGTRPNQAALKAFNWYCRRNNVMDDTVHFDLVERTSDGKNHKYSYTGVRKLLEKPKEIVRTGKTITIKHETTVHKNKGGDAAIVAVKPVEEKQVAVAVAVVGAKEEKAPAKGRKAKAAVVEEPKVEEPKEEVKPKSKARKAKATESPKAESPKEVAKEEPKAKAAPKSKGKAAK